MEEECCHDLLSITFTMSKVLLNLYLVLSGGFMSKELINSVLSLPRVTELTEVR